MRAHTHPSLPVIGEKTLSWNSFPLLYMSWLIDSLTPAVALPVSCRLRRYPGCVSPGSRRASVRSPPCSRQRSLIFRRRAVQPLSLFSPAAQLAHTKVIPAAPTAAERRGARRAARQRNNKNVGYRFFLDSRSRTKVVFSNDLFKWANCGGIYISCESLSNKSSDVCHPCGGMDALTKQMRKKSRPFRWRVISSLTGRRNYKNKVVVKAETLRAGVFFLKRMTLMQDRGRFLV